MRFQRERVLGILSEIGSLNQKHFQEVGKVYGFDLQPDIQAYQKIEDSEALRIFTARNAEHELVGYQLFVVSSHLFFSIPVATQNLLYFAPGERRNALSFMRYCDRELEKEGVKMIRQYVTLQKDFSSVLKRLGYAEVERVFVRGL